MRHDLRDPHPHARRRSRRRERPGRRLRPAGRLQLRRARRAATARSTGCACRATTARRCSRGCSIPTPGTGRSARVASSRSSAATCPGTLVIETTFTTDDRQRAADRRAGVRRGPARPRPRPRRAARAAAPASRASTASVSSRMELAPRPEYGLVQPLFRATEDGGAHVRRPQPDRRARRRAGRGRRRDDDARRSPSREGERGRLRAALGRRRGRAARRRRRPPTCRRAHRGHRRGVALLGGRARHLRGPAPRARALQRARAEGPDLPADRRDRRGADHVAARDGRRRAQLGLPLRVDPRREPHARGALHRRLLRRGRGVRLVHDELRGRRHGRATRCRSCTGSAASTTSPSASCRTCAAGATRARARRQRRLEPDPARRLRRAAERAAPLPRAARRAASRRSSSFVADLADAAARRWSERDAGMWEMRGEPRHHLSSKVLCWTALDRAVKLAPQLGEYAQGRGVGGGARRRSARRSSSAAGARSGRPTRSRSTPTSSTRAQLLMPLVGFLPATDPRMRSTIEAIARDLTEDGLVLRYRNEEGLNADGLTRRGGHVRDLLVLARLVPGAGRRGRARRGALRPARRATRTTSACSPRRSTPPTASCSATSRRRSATSA